MPMVHGQRNEELVRALQPESHFLDMLHRDFCTHFRFRDSKIVSFYETLQSPTAAQQPDGSWKMTGKLEVLVTKSSATGSRPEEPAYHDISIQATHSGMVKFSGETDKEYIIVRDKIKQFRDEGPMTISKRFHSGAPLGYSITEAEHLLRIKNGWSHLHLAAHKGSVEVVTKLLEQGAGIEQKANKGETALSVASSAGNEAVTKLLLDRNANIHAKNFIGTTALYYASEGGHSAVVALLLDHGGDVKVTIQGRWTCLHRAAGQGKEDVVKLLLDHGAQIEATSTDQFTPLHSAAECGYDRCVKLLLSRGATIEAKTVDGRAPLYVAAEAGHAAVVRLLLEEGFAIPDATTNTLWTPLHIAAHKGYDV
ncbi:ankyrin repeat-containing domain protein, partial [Sphaerosporella brunnea]